MRILEIYSLLVILLGASCTHAHQEYVYPVASYRRDTGEVVALLLYQKSANHTELWEWNPQTKQANKALLSTYTPAGVRMLPDNTGFSFLDDGRIRIKQAIKRSPKTIDIYQPLYNLGVVEWIDGHHGYFTACKDKRYALFHLALCGPVEEIFGDADSVDCLYPQKVGKELFYIERSVTAPHRYFLVSRPYPEINHVCHQSLIDFDNTFFAHSTMFIPKKEDKKILIDNGEDPLIFLTMISNDMGFVIGHPVSVDKQESFIPFSCFLLTKQKDSWLLSFLFFFCIPMNLFVSSSDFLYESLFPLIPCYQNDFLYFASAPYGNQPFNIYSYSLSTQLIEQCTHNTDMLSVLLPPRIVDNQLFYGGSIFHDSERDHPSKSIHDQQIPFMMFDSEGEICFEIPTLNTKGNFLT